MKLLLYITLSLLIISPVFTQGDDNDNNYEDISLQDFENDQQANDALDYSINWIFEGAADKYGISSANPQVNEVYSVSRWEDDETTSYRFNVSASNEDATIDGTFTVECQNDSDDKKVVRFNYHIDYETPNGNGESETEVESYTDEEDQVEEEEEEEEQVEEEEEENQEEEEEEQEEQEVYVEEQEEEEEEEEENENSDECREVSDVENDDLLNDLMKSGMRVLFEKAADKFGVSDDNVEITKINSVCRKEEDSTISYNFDVDATNNDNATMQATFTMRWNRDTQKRTLARYHYDIQYDNKDDDQTENYVDVNVPEGYEEVPYTEDDKPLNNALEYGIAWIMKRANYKFGVSDNKAVVTKLNGVYRMEKDSKVYYRFSVEANNDDDAWIDGTFTVEWNTETDEREMDSFRYHIVYKTKSDSNNTNWNENECAEENGEVEVEVEINIENYEGWNDQN